MSNFMGDDDQIPDWLGIADLKIAAKIGAITVAVTAAQRTQISYSAAQAARTQKMSSCAVDALPVGVPVILETLQALQGASVVPRIGGLPKADIAYGKFGAGFPLIDS